MSFWDKIYCINLDRRKDRWGQCQEQFAKYDMKVERFPAYETDIGSVGCYQSHLEIYRLAISQKLDNVLIFEDDVMFLDDGMKTINVALEELNKISWDAFFYGVRTNRIIPYKGSLAFLGNGTCLHAYGLSKRFLPTIYKKAKEQWDKNNAPHYFVPIDNAGVCDRMELYESFTSIPLACIQRESFSDLHKQVVDYSGQNIQQSAEAVHKPGYTKVLRLISHDKMHIRFFTNLECKVIISENHVIIEGESLSLGTILLGRDGQIYRDDFWSLRIYEI